MEYLAIVFCNLQKYTDAQRLQVQVVDVRKKIFGEKHPKTVKAVALLAELRSQANQNTPGTEDIKKVSLIHSGVHLIHIFMTLAQHFSKMATKFAKILKRKVLQYSNISQMINSYLGFQ
jgi:hypothetical protein